GMAAEMRRPEETRELRALGAPRRLYRFDLPAQVLLEGLDRLGDEVGYFGIDPRMIEIRTVGDPRLARAMAEMAWIVGGLRLEAGMIVRMRPGHRPQHQGGVSDGARQRSEMHAVVAGCHGGLWDAAK